MDTSSSKWLYADKDADAVSELERRLADAACGEDGFITYTALVRGVKFALAKGNRTEIIEINTDEWYGHERAILGDYLGFIASRTYHQAGFLASALAISKEGEPSKHFFDFAQAVGALKAGQDRIEFWLKQADRAREWYRRLRQSAQ